MVARPFLVPALVFASISHAVRRSAEMRRIAGVLNDVSALLQKPVARTGEQSAFQVVQKLVQGITPAAKGAMDTTLRQAISEMEKHMQTLIITERNATQTAIDKALEAVRSSTNIALQAKTLADTADNTLVACRGVERIRLQEWEVSKGVKAWEAFKSQREQCMQYDEHRQVHVCAFGRHLTSKCKAWGEFKQLDAQIDGLGSERSEFDSKAAWETLSVATCMLNLIVKSEDLVDVEFNADSLASCTSAVDSASDIGVLDRKQIEFEALIYPNKFTCTEREIVFSGFIWDVPEPPGVEADSVFMEEISSVPRHQSFRPPNQGEGCSMYEGILNGTLLGSSAHTVTMALWFNPTAKSKGTIQFLLNVGQENIGAHHWIWGGADDGLFGKYNGEGTERISGQSISGASTLVTVFDGQTYKLYINGESHNSISPGLGFLDIETQTIAIGGIRSNSEHAFSGCVGGVDVYRAALNEKQVKASIIDLEANVTAWRGKMLARLAASFIHSWLVVANTTKSGQHWDVRRVKFLLASGEELGPHTPGCAIVDSGKPGPTYPQYLPENAFADDSSIWGGRKDGESNQFYIGLKCQDDHDVVSAQIEQGNHSSHVASTVSFNKDNVVQEIRDISKLGELEIIYEKVFQADVVFKQEIPSVPAHQSFRPPNQGAGCSMYKGMLDGHPLHGSAHTVTMALWFDPTAKHTGAMQFLLNVGQSGTGAHHWFWTGKGEGVFGKWNGDNATRISRQLISGANTLVTVFDGQTYKLYINGEFHTSISPGQGFLDIETQTIAIGGIRSNSREHDFSGCVGGVDVYREALTESQVKASIIDLEANVTAWRGKMQARLAALFIHSWLVVANTMVSGHSDMRRANWNVRRVKFLLASGEELGPHTPGCAIVDSRNAGPGYLPENAFADDSSIWGGVKDAVNQFYIGLKCQDDHDVVSAQIEQSEPSYPSTVSFNKDNKVQEIRDISKLGELEIIYEKVFQADVVFKQEIPSVPAHQSFRPPNQGAGCSMYKGMLDGHPLHGSAHTVTMALWFDPTAKHTGATQFLLNVGKDDTGAHHWIWGGNKGEGVFGKWNGDTTTQISNQLISGASTLVTVFDGQTYKVYINGEFHTSISPGQGFLDIETQTIAIGGIRSNSSEHDFSGCVGGVDVYREALTESQVKASIAKLEANVSAWRSSRSTVGFSSTADGYKKVESAVPISAYNEGKFDFCA